MDNLIKTSTKKAPIAIGRKSYKTELFLQKVRHNNIHKRQLILKPVVRKFPGPAGLLQERLPRQIGLISTDESLQKEVVRFKLGFLFITILCFRT